MKFLTLSTGDSHLDNTPQVKKWLEETTAKLEKFKVKVKYHTPTSEGVETLTIEDTFEGHYVRTQQHMMIYGVSSVEYLLGENDEN